ncbi:Gfo/Idh/MocA family protein [Lysobacter korlensis]|uniref:Gfo/Idh/MocA family protein n=1 Tax=Lysobacter korlensis TaxID=553636 RepID=A0ABV6RSZ8_9GAMM
MTVVKAAFIGFGWFAELLMTRVFADVPELEVVAVVDPSEERRKRAEEMGLAAVQSMDELPAGCDAVVVLTPHDTHRGIVEAAARKGLHVFCEKAFAVTSDDCLAMIDACRAAGVVLTVGHMQKLFPTHARAVELARGGNYGDVMAIQVAGSHWCPVMPGWWRSKESCGGLLYWTGIHDLDTMRAMTGSDVASVMAMAGPKTDDYTEYEDSISVTLRYENGAVASLLVAEHDPLRTFEEAFQISVLLERGSIHVDPGTGRVTHASREGQERSAAATLESFGSFEGLEEHAYREEFRAFAQRVLSGDRDDPTAEDGLRCVETLEAIYASLQSGQVTAVVKHPF